MDANEELKYDISKLHQEALYLVREGHMSLQEYHEFYKGPLQELYKYCSFDDEEEEDENYDDFLY